MTDMITVSRKEIEKLQKLSPNSDGTMLLGGEDAYPRYIDLNDLRALLDKAEVSEPVGEGYPLIRLGYGLVEVGTGEVDGEPVVLFTNHGTGVIGDNTVNEPRVNNQEDVYAAISITKIESLNIVRKQLDIFARTYLNETPPDQSAKIAELEAEVARLKLSP